MDEEMTARGRLGYDFSNYSKSFRFGVRDSNAIALDLSLANLFQKLTVECSGVLGNPQWKHYRHMQLLKKDQIRLSNGIWRSWHIQFQKGRKPLFCKFVIDPEMDMESHRVPQGVVIEGKYWKRTRQAVANEYRKWRLFYKQKNQWSDIKRLPNTAGTALHSNLQQQEVRSGVDNLMQVELSDANRLGSLLQGLEEFSDFSFNMPRPGDERSYMRPLVDAAEMMQPNLDTLNPTLDELLERLEPMEVMFPPLFSTNGGGRPQFSTSSFIPQTAPPITSDSDSYLVQATSLQQQPQSSSNQYENQSGGAQYGAQYMTTPTKPVHMSTDEQAFSQSVARGYPGGEREFQLSPSVFLNAPQAQEIRLRTETDPMDLGTPPTAVAFSLKSELGGGSNIHCTRPQFEGRIPPPTALYQQQSNQSAATPTATPQFASLPMAVQQQDESSSFYMQQDGMQTHPLPRPLPPSTPDQSPVVAMYNYPNVYNPIPPSNPSSYPATPIQPPPPGGGYTGSTSEGSDSSFNQSAAAGANPDIHFIAEQMKRLEEQQLEQLREIEKQQNIATQQYLQLLQQYLSDSGEQPTAQQQRDLKAVLSDPATVQILKSILIQDSSGGKPKIATPPQSMTPPTSTVTPPIAGIKQELVSPHQSSVDLQSLAAIGDSPVVPRPMQSPTQLVKASGVSDFQSRLVMAAAAQACTPLSFSVPPAEPVAATPKIKSPEIHGHEGGIPPALLKKFKNARNLTPDEKRMYQELRRQSHITAEQRRRGSIKNGFEQLQSLVVNPAQYPSGKVSKAVLLEKTIEYLRQKHFEREIREKRINELKEEISALNQSITQCQQQLPVSGVPITTRQRFEENRQLFRDYIQQRTNQNYKFWIYSIILQHLFGSYNNMVSTASPEVFCQSVLTWFDQSCSLPALRPVVMSSLKELSVKTSILSDPSKLPQQLSQYANSKK